MKVIFLNGPPHCGKDWGGNALHKKLSRSYPIKFAAPIKFMIGAIVHEPITVIESKKEDTLPFPSTQIDTYRELMIHISEQWMKPDFGDDIFGRLAVKRIAQLTPAPDYVIVTDSGFAEEAQPVGELVGWDNCLLIHINADGTTFEGDSRSYITLPCASATIHNDFTPAFGERLYNAVQRKWP